MKDRLKKALKRIASGIMAVLLAVCIVGTPRAKAVVSEGAMLGSLFGSLLVSMGFSWAADNMDSPTFGESIYKLTQEFDEAMQGTGAQLIRDLSLAGVTATGSGKLQFGYQWVQAANSFAEWFQDKFLSTSNSAVITSSPGSIALTDGSLLHLSTWNGDFNTSPIFGTKIESGDYFTFSTGCILSYLPESNGNVILLVSKADHTGVTQVSLPAGSYVYVYKINGSTYTGYYHANWKGYSQGFIIPADYIYATAGSSLSAEKPQEVHYPVVAEDGSQVYEITVDGVTATDIEGIIQGAVDRILAGTVAIAGSVEQAGTSEEVTNPEIDPYKVSLTTIFPFCIPFDIYNMVTMFVAEPEAPHAEWTFYLPWSNQEYSVGWDLSDFDGVAQVCRSLELVLFAVGLAVITHKVIKW